MQCYNATFNYNFLLKASVQTLLAYKEIRKYGVIYIFVSYVYIKRFCVSKSFTVFF